jgi:hypothetical protein
MIIPLQKMTAAKDTAAVIDGVTYAFYGFYYGIGFAEWLQHS